MTFKRLSFLLLIVTCFFIAGCDFLTPTKLPLETADFVAANPPSGSTLQPDATITVTFDGVPGNVAVNPGAATLAGQTVTISGPFPAGSLSLVLAWGDGYRRVLNYTVAVEPPPPDDNKSDDNQEFPLRDTIVPGVEAAGIKLGDTLDRVKQIYGEPSKEDEWSLDWDPTLDLVPMLSVSLDDNGRVKSIIIYHSIRAKTAGGVGIGSTKQRVWDEFGAPLQITSRGNNEWYRTKGIAFSYDDADIGLARKVDVIIITKPLIRDVANFAPVRIVPGVKAAEIELGDTKVSPKGLDRVKQIYGEPNREDAWFSYWDLMGLAVFFDASGHVSSLYISAPNRVQTAGGVGIGSTKQRVRDEFGRPEEITVSDVDERYWFWARGIEFTFAFEGNRPAEKVTRIQIFLPKR